MCASHLGKATYELDAVLAVAISVVTLGTTIWLVLLKQPIFAVGSFLALAACIAYLLLRKRLPLPESVAFPQTQLSSKFWLLLNTIFFALLIYSIISLHLRPELYTRPLGYFVALAAMAAILAIEILFLPSRKSATYFALFKIMIIILSLVWSQLLIYPSIVGMDPWGHEMFTLKILDAGHIPSGYDYSWLPCMHLLIGGTSLITGLDYKMATMFSVSLSQVICTILFIFLLGKFIHSVKAGLLAALSLGTATYFIWFSYWTISNTMGVVFIPIIIYLLFKLREEKPKASICLSALFIALVILTHTISTVTLVVILFSIWLGFEVYKRLRYQAAERAWVFLVAALVLTGAGLIYWIFVSGDIHRLIVLARMFGAKFLAIFAPGAGPPPQELSPLEAAVIQYQTHVVPFSEGLFDQLGFLLFCVFALIGGLAMLSRRLRNRYGFGLVMAGFITLIVTCVGIAADFFAAERFSYPSQVLLAIPVGIALLWLGSLPGRKIASACLIGIVVFALLFLTVMSPSESQDNGTFSPNTMVRYTFTQSELEAINTISHVYDGKTGTDWYIWNLVYGTGLNWYIGYPRPVLALHASVEDIGEQIYLRDFSHLDDTLILLRKEIIEQPFKISGQGIYRLTYDPRQTLAEQGFSEIYDCGSVSGFIK
jgi:hypothetical protein